jgi:hypothetical protein
MSSNEVDIQLIAYDQASAVIESVGSTLTTTFTDIEGNTQQLASTTDDATSQISSDYDQVNSSAQDMANNVDTASSSCQHSGMAMNSAALAGMSLFLSFERVHNSEVQLDRAHLMVERSTAAVEKAQDAYNQTVAKYGPDSQQAKDAADKLSIAQDALRVAQERAQVAQNNVNNSMIMAALTVIPSLISVVNVIGNAERIWEGIQWALNAAMDANPAAIIAVAITTLVAIIIAAYNACPPFRDALNAIGAVLGGALEIAIEAITTGLTWLWKNVFEPLVNFIENYIVTEVEILSKVFTWLWQNVLEPLGKFLSAVFGVAIKAISDICNFLWNNVLKPLGDFLIGAFEASWKELAGIFQWFYNLVKPIIDAVSAVADALGGFVNAVGGAMGGASKSISSFIHGVCFAHALADASESSEKTLKHWTGMVDDSMHKGLTSIKDFNAQAQIGGVGVIGAIGAVGTLPTGPSHTVVNIDQRAPLLYVEGSMDKATADYASKQVMQQLKTIIVEPTSSQAGSTQKKIRSGSVFG